MKKDFKYICWGGGGAKGISNAGVYYMLKQNGFLDSIKVHAGVSIGAFTAMLSVLNFSSKEVNHLFVFTPMENFFADIRFSNLTTENYLSSGDAIKDFLQQLIEKKGFHKDVTLRQLYQKTNLILITFVVDKLKGKIIKYNAFDHPNYKVLDAVYESMTLPLLFKPNLTTDGGKLLDGGILENNPFHHFPLDETICIRLGKRFQYDQQIFRDSKKLSNIARFDKNFDRMNNVFYNISNRIKDVVDDMYSVLSMSIDYTEYEALKGKALYEIIVDSKGTSTLTTKLSKIERTNLVLEGVTASYAFVKNPQKTIPIPESMLYDIFDLDKKTL